MQNSAAAKFRANAECRRLTTPGRQLPSRPKRLPWTEILRRSEEGIIDLPMSEAAGDDEGLG